MIDAVLIPKGSFLMGSRDVQDTLLMCELPQHTVEIPEFWMSKFPTTQAQWRYVANLPKVNIELNPEPSFFKGLHLPVESVSWYEAVEFCKRISVLYRQTFRLPSEAEWEYACRAGTTTSFHFGDISADSFGNFDSSYFLMSHQKGIWRKTTTEIETFPPNAFGLYDMHGNVGEWCQDDWHENYEGAPTDGSSWLKENSHSKIVRGGSWYDLPSFCKSSSRSEFDPNRTNNLIGFRVVCTN
jgi:formylglycine-generating enzyme required for sulfatase activity